MLVHVEMPFVGESVEQLRVRAWLKAIGERVEREDPLVEVTTEKIDFTIEAPAAGTLIEIRAGEDTVVAPHAVLGVIASE